MFICETYYNVSMWSILHTLYVDQVKLFIFVPGYTLYMKTSLSCSYLDQFTRFVCGKFTLLICGPIYTVNMGNGLNSLYVDQFTPFICRTNFTLYMWNNLHCLYVHNFTIFIFKWINSLYIWKRSTVYM